MNVAKEAGFVNLNGDGKCDSPGHNAKCGVYTMMGNAGKIMTLSLVQCSEVTSSNAMEKEGFERCLQELEQQITVQRNAIDRHLLISMSMDKKSLPHQAPICLAPF